jgi:hypothetical protein
MEKKTYVIRKSLTGPKTYRKWSEWETGDVVVGKYVSTEEDSYDKTNRILELEYCSFNESLVGKKLVLNSCGSVDSAFEQVDFGDIVQVEYKGIEKLEKGKFAGKDAHSLEISVVEEEGPEEDVEVPF